MSRWKNKITFFIALFSSLWIGAVPISVYAKVEPVEDTVPEAEEVMEETYGPLTPDGNLTLVDDYGKDSGEGKQFITLVTKAGNYFYLVIDRDDQGSETVHFLNLVDEEDLLSLLDEETAKKYEQQEVQAEEASIVETSTEEMEAEPEEEKKGVVIPILLFAALAGIGGVFYVKQKKEKEQNQSDVHPDDDYEEEEDYLASLKEE